jgi:two-component system, NtrC family, sensor kinase
METPVEIRRRYNSHYFPCLLVFITMLVLPGIIPADLNAQQSKIDSLHEMFRTASHDTVRVKALNGLSNTLNRNNPDSALALAGDALELATTSGYHRGRAAAEYSIGLVYIESNDYGEAYEHYTNALEIMDDHDIRDLENKVLSGIGSVYYAQADYLKALDYYHKALDRSKELGDDLEIGRTLHGLGVIYAVKGDGAKSLSYYKRALELYKVADNKDGVISILNNIGNRYLHTLEYGKAMTYYKRALKLSREGENHKRTGMILRNIGEIYFDQGDYERALEYSQRSLSVRLEIGDQRGIAFSMLDVGRIYNKQGRYDDALAYGREAARISSEILATNIERLAYEVMYTAFKGQHSSDSALVFFEKYVVLKDSLMGEEKQSDLNRLTMKYEADQREQKIALLEKDKKLQEKDSELQEVIRNAMIGGFIVLVIFAGGLYRRYWYKKRTSEQLQSSFDLLQRTQQQLIHAEMMATLGELTAGVAHEIKNPLNFITNFSEMNEEVAREIEKHASGNEVLAEGLATLMTNTEKIREHGKHADSIVNSMLMHSRNTQGVRQETNINDIVREAVELAQHGAPPGTVVDLVMNLNEDTGQADVLSAEISRVVLNLVVNAMYAARRKADTDRNVQPQVQASTARTSDEIHIRVEDNGTGISDEVMEKLFQPFFTTKPAGDGTGLGLSLCWFIVTDGHNGTIEVESEEGNGATFIVKLPLEG